MTDAVASPLSRDITTQQIGVDVEAVEKELAALWRDASKEKHVTRACSWNLVVHAGDDAICDMVTPIIDEVVAHVPSRALVLKPRPFATGKEIDAWVSANCQIAPGGGKLLCTEEITIEARGRAGGEHLPGLMRALNVPDVPTALWWAGPPPTDPAAARLLLAGVDRLVFDSARFTDDDAAFAGLRKVANLTGMLDGLTCVDLAWLRSSSLRTLFASIFDVVDPASLQRATRVVVKCSTSGISTAKLMVGWLASRLGWGAPERTQRGQLSWQYSVHGTRTLAVVIDTAMEPSARASGIVGVALECSGGERFALAEVDAVTLRIDAPPAPRLAHAHEFADAQLLVAALGARGRDRLFAVALHRAIELDR